MPFVRVNAEIHSKAATCEPEKICRLDGHARGEAQLRVLRLLLSYLSCQQTRPGAFEGPCLGRLNFLCKPSCGKCGQPLLQGQALDLYDGNFDAIVAAIALPVLVDFWAAWCNRGEMMAPAFKQAAAERSAQKRCSFGVLSFSFQPHIRRFP